MRYDLTHLPIEALFRPVAEATAALVRLDERVARSPIGQGWIERAHFWDACASLWVDGELVHIEDLVLHDAGHDIRTPTHELTIAHDVLRTRRRIAAQPPGWALGAEGLASLRGRHDDQKVAPETKSLVAARHTRALPEDGEAADETDALAEEFAEIDAVLARTEAVIAEVRAPARSRLREKDPLVYDLDWDEDERLAEWRAVMAESHGLPPVMRAVVALDAWNQIEVLQHAPWLGRQLAAAVLREAGLTTFSHLLGFNTGMKSVPYERRRHPRRDMRLSALLQGLVAAVEFGLREHDRLMLARQMMERKMQGRRSSSRLPALVELILTRPLVSAGMIAEALEITPRAALRIVEELGLRELTGRGRFRAWGVL